MTKATEGRARPPAWLKDHVTTSKDRVNMTRASISDARSVWLDLKTELEYGLSICRRRSRRFTFTS